MKPFFVLLAVLMSMVAWAEDDRVGHYKKILLDCGNPSISVLKFSAGALLSSTNLDLDCVKKKFNDHHSQKELYLSEKTRIKTVVKDDYLNKQFFYVQGPTPHLQNVKTITSMYSETCGEQCFPAEDFIYQTGNRYWFMFANYGSSEINVLKINEIGEPQLILFANNDSNTFFVNFLINIPLNKVTRLGHGSFEFNRISVDEVDYRRNMTKSYFKGGGAFWFDATGTYSFKTDSKKNTQFINAKGKGLSCFPRETFLEMTTFKEKLFKDLEEVCVYM